MISFFKIAHYILMKLEVLILNYNIFINARMKIELTCK